MGTRYEIVKRLEAAGYDRSYYDADDNYSSYFRHDEGLSRNVTVTNDSVRYWLKPDEKEGVQVLNFNFNFWGQAASLKKLEESGAFGKPPFQEIFWGAPKLNDAELGGDHEFESYGYFIKCSIHDNKDGSLDIWDIEVLDKNGDPVSVSDDLFKLAIYGLI